MDLERRRAMLTIASSAAFPLLAPGVVLAATPGFVGVWSAFLASDDPPTRLKLEIKPDHSAALTVIDSGPIPLSGFEIRGKRLHFEIGKAQLVYDARLAGSGRLKGICRRGDKTYPLDFVRGDLYTEPPLVVFPPACLSQARLHALRTMARAPAMGVGWQCAGHDTEVLVDGLRSIEASVAVTRRDQWHLGSVTKSMTATLTARIVESGKLHWHSTIGDVLRDRIGNIQPGYHQVTLLHLLSHHGGLPRDVELNGAERKQGISRAEYVHLALQHSPRAPMGETMFYSNVDYVTVGLMLETVTGKTWEVLIGEQLFKPLGIRSYGFGPPGSAHKLDEPRGHVPGPLHIEPVYADIPKVMGPAGRVHMDLTDLVTYLKAHRDMPGSLLSADSWKRLHTPPFEGNYALGWFVDKDGTLTHGGTNSRWKAEVMVDGKDALVCAAVANVLNHNTESALKQLESSAQLTARQCV